MTDITSAKDKKTLGSKLASTVLVFTVPVLLLVIIGLLSGSLAFGVVEITLLWAIWLVGLASRTSDGDPQVVGVVGGAVDGHPGEVVRGALHVVRREPRRSGRERLVGQSNGSLAQLPRRG